MNRRSLCPAISAVLLCLLSPAANGQGDGPLTTLETGDIYFLQFLEEGRRVVCNTVVWDLETEEVVQAIQWEETFSFRLPFALSPDRKTLGVGKDHRISLYDLESGDHLRNIPVSENRPYALAFSPDGSKLLCGPSLHDAHSGERLWRAPVGMNANEVAYSPDGNKVAIEDTRNGTVTIWDVSDLNTAVQDWPEHEQKVRRVDGVK